MLKLSQGERSHPIWHKVYEHLEEELRYAQLNLEKLTNQDETNVARGRIRAIRELMDANNEQPIVL